MKIIGIAGTNSSKSINAKLVKYTLGLANDVETEYFDIKDLDIPIFGEDIEREKGIPQPIKDFHNRIKDADALIISVAEHNGNLTVFFKNVLDWLSRYYGKFFDGQKVLLIGTSPGKGGAHKAMGLMDRPVTYAGGKFTAQFSFPSFGENTSEVDGEIEITNEDLLNKLKEKTNDLVKSL